MNKGIKYLIFDLGGVLVNLNRLRCIRNFKKLGFHRAGKLIGSFQQEGIFMQLEKGIITSEEFRNNIRKEIDKPITNEEIDAAWNSFLGSTPGYKLDLLLKLRSEYELYLLSNTNEIHWKWCLEHTFAYKGHCVDDFFDRVFLSFEMQKAKPGLKIFQAVLNETGIRPEETFFIDDSPANCETAEAFGISTYTPRTRENWSHLFK